MLRFHAVVRPPFPQKIYPTDFILISYFSQFFSKQIKSQFRAIYAIMYLPLDIIYGIMNQAR